jgi:acyl-homoserine lactone acylase PvdQ
MGPQLGYYYPEIVYQEEMHAPGLDAEGVVAPISPYVFIGRGKEFAWSLTSEGAENTQQFLEKLCNPEGGEVTRSTDTYEYDGNCVPFTTVDAGTIGAGNGEPEHEVTFQESVHGPISGTVKVNGELYAVATDRADRGKEPAGETAFSMMDSDEVHNPQEFFNAANHLETTFNMAYVDSKHIAFFSTGLLPKTAPGTNPSLPTYGTGQYDWKGYLSQEEHPHEVDPTSGLLLNWNNKPAPGWGAASTEWGEGPLQRVLEFSGFPTSGAKLYNDVDVMNKAATQDFRARFVWPEIEKVLATGPAPSKLAEEAANEVSEWSANGSSLRGARRPKAPAAAVIYKVFDPIAETVLAPVLGEQLQEAINVSGGVDNGPNSSGSSFGGGWYGYVYKDLKEVLGEPVAQPYSQEFCGNGSLSACRESLWKVIQKGVEELSAEQGPAISAWRAPGVRITFPPLPFVKNTMAWTNRSTFQQAIEFVGGSEEG